LRRSIALRLVVAFGVTSLTSFALIGTVLYSLLQSETVRHQRGELESLLSNVEYSVVRTETPERWERVVRSKLDALAAADGSVRLWVLSDDPRYRYGGAAEMPALAASPDGMGAVAGGRLVKPRVTMIRSIPAMGDRPAVRIVAGIDQEPYQRTLDTYGRALIVLLAGVLLLTVLLGWWIARVGLRPLQRLSREAQALQPKTLSQRLATASLPIELRDLAEAFNGALGRLEAAYTQLEAFNADVAHELRTPLANLIGGSQVALSRRRSATEFEETLQSNLEELERLRSIINDMLFLARADQGEAATGLAQANVAQEVEKMLEFFDAVLEDKEIEVTVQGELQAQATMNIALFRRALSNLLRNAVEHAPAGARLTVEITRQDASVWVRVANPGATIASEHLPRLFDRFYRVDAARLDAGEARGHGLGLAIVKAVASMHGGGVSAASRDGVTTIAFSVPGAARQGL
jgi:two-component system heavy metal sensor histidine kinase CusS